jgi:hypothetical protein
MVVTQNGDERQPRPGCCVLVRCYVCAPLVKRIIVHFREPNASEVVIALDLCAFTVQESTNDRFTDGYDICPGDALVWVDYYM